MFLLAWETLCVIYFGFELIAKDVGWNLKKLTTVISQPSHTHTFFRLWSCQWQLVHSKSIVSWQHYRLRHRSDIYTGTHHSCDERVWIFRLGYWNTSSQCYPCLLNATGNYLRCLLCLSKIIRGRTDSEVDKWWIRPLEWTMRITKSDAVADSVGVYIFLENDSIVKNKNSRS